MIYNPDALDFYNTITTATSPLIIHDTERELFFKHILPTAVTLGSDKRAIENNFAEMNNKLATPFTDVELYGFSRSFLNKATV